MKPARFILHTPRTLAEALDLVQTLPNVRVLAGGQSLVPMLNRRVLTPEHLVDLNGLRELRYIREERDDIAFGAMTRQRDIDLCELTTARLPLFKAAIASVGTRQTRNRGTIGGSLCQLDASAELPLVAMAMSATLLIGSARGTRCVPIAEFAHGVGKPALDDGEILLEVRVAPWTPRHGWSFKDFARRPVGFSIASAAVLVDVDGAGKISRIALALAGRGQTPLRLDEAERKLLGSGDPEATVDLAAAEADTCDLPEDVAYPAWYRRRLFAGLLRRATREALERARAR